MGREEQEMEFKAHSKCGGGCPPLPRTAGTPPPSPNWLSSATPLLSFCDDKVLLLPEPG